MKVDICQQLLRLNQGFDQILTALAALRQYPVFPADKLERFTALSKETRAAETTEAGRRYQKRCRPERKDDAQM